LQFLQFVPRELRELLDDSDVRKPPTLIQIARCVWLGRPQSQNQVPLDKTVASTFAIG
jgi:hypothetical protein